MIADLGRALDALYQAQALLPGRADTADTRRAIADAIVAVLAARGKLMRWEPNDAA